MYTVNGAPFDSFFAAVAEAKKQNAEVFETSTGTRRWCPVPKNAAKRTTRHVLVRADGSEVEFSKVGR